MSVTRNAALVDQVMVVGNVDNYHLSEHILKKLGKEYIDIIEATPRNTAAAIAFAALASNPDDILLVTPSDHVIEGDTVYTKAIEIATKKYSADIIRPKWV